MAAAVEPLFTSIGANRVANGLDWGAGGLVAYAGHAAAVVYEPRVSARGRARAPVQTPLRPAAAVFAVALSRPAALRAVRG